MRTKYWWKFQTIYFNEGWEEWGVPEETEYYVLFSKISWVRYRSRSNCVKGGVQLTSLIAVQTSTVRIWFHLHPPSRTLVPKKSNLKRASFARYDPVWCFRTRVIIKAYYSCVESTSIFVRAHFKWPHFSSSLQQCGWRPGHSITSKLNNIGASSYICPMSYIVFMSYVLCPMPYAQYSIHVI